MAAAFNIYKNEINSASPSLGYINTYNRKTGLEIFEEAYRGFLKLLNQLLTVHLWSHISPRCFHSWGGAKMMLREGNAWRQQGDFIFKTDIYSYYATVNHVVLQGSLFLPHKGLESIMAYCRRTILSSGKSLHFIQGLPKGGDLSSSLVGCLYLSPLDQAMERWSNRDGCFYARFQDGILIAFRKRHLYRATRREMYRCLEELRMSLRFEKTFIGRSPKGFELLGYHSGEGGLSLSLKTQEKAIKKARQRYAQGGLKSLLSYLIKGWRIFWARSGSSF